MRSWPSRRRSSDDPEVRRACLTFVVVGGGPTGVEMAGAFAEIARHSLARDFRRIDPRTARVVLVEAGSRILPAFPEDLSRSAARQLEALGVQVWTGAAVTGVDASGVSLGTERLAARTVVWAAGVMASPLGRTLGAPTDSAGRVLVRSDLTVPGHPEVFVVGDLAGLEQDGQRVPGVAPAAMQMGGHAARNVGRALREEPLLPFRYVDKGSLATIGRSSGVALFGRMRSARLRGLGGLARHPHLLPHRFPESAHRAPHLGVGLPHLRAQRPPHPGFATRRRARRAIC